MSSSFYFFIFSLMKPTKHANSVSTSSSFKGRWSVICYSVFYLKMDSQHCLPNNLLMYQIKGLKFNILSEVILMYETEREI